MTVENEIHDVRKILQDAVAKLAVLERDHDRLLTDYKARLEQIRFLEENVGSNYRHGFFDGLAVAEYTTQVSRHEDALEEIRNMTDSLRANPNLSMAFVAQLLRDLIKETLRPMASEPEAAGVLDEAPPAHFSITGKPLS